MLHDLAPLLHPFWIVFLLVTIAAVTCLLWWPHVYKRLPKRKNVWSTDA